MRKKMKNHNGRIMTSLEMHGMSLTLLELEKETKDYVLKCLRYGKNVIVGESFFSPVDAPVNCKNWSIRLEKGQNSAKMSLHNLFFRENDRIQIATNSLAPFPPS